MYTWHKFGIYYYILLHLVKALVCSKIQRHVNLSV